MRRASARIQTGRGRMITNRDGTRTVLSLDRDGAVTAARTESVPPIERPMPPPTPGLRGAGLRVREGL